MVGSSSREEETPISPKDKSPVPEIFSTKKIFFLNSSCSGSRRSDIPHIESGYCPRDEVSRRLFHRNRGSCDCDCVSDGCCGCLRRNKQVFFKAFVLALSIALILLLFGSLSYNLTRHKDDDESREFEQIEFESHYHDYFIKEENKRLDVKAEDPESSLNSPVPVYEHSDDYEGSHEDVEPFRLPLLNQPRANTQPTVIYDVREPDRKRRSLPVQNENVAGQESKFHEKRQSKSLPEELNEIEEGMEMFWESFFKKSRTVFQSFSLSTPAYSTPLQNDDYITDDTVIEDELKNKFLSPVVEQKVTFHNGNSITERIKVTQEKAVIWPLKSTTSELETEQWNEEEKESTDYTNGADVEDGVVTESSASTTEADEDEVPEVTEKAAMDAAEEFRTLFSFPLQLPGILIPNRQDTLSESSPPNNVKGISLSDAKKMKNERRKLMLLNSRVVGGSSDVRLPTGPDSSKPIVNAFETLKTNQQLSFTPSAASQFVLPYQMCLFGGPYSGPRPLPHMVQPRTFSFGPLVHPFLGGNQPPKDYQPAQQNFLSLNINNFPNAAPPRPPSGSGFGFPIQQNFPQYPYNGLGSSRQPIFCTYLQPPLFQFPTVPGTADFTHAKCLDCQDDARKAAFIAKDIFLSGRETLCSSDKVSCIDGSGCIPLVNWCDNRVHCRDASDEAFCSCRERIAKDRLCDGYVDCPHGEDETGCFDCPKTSFMCENPTGPGTCIPLSLRCDGIRDCATGVDEMDCSALFFNIRQKESYQVSQVSGFLHRNWKGEWFPVCMELGDTVWAKEACAAELGFYPNETEVKFAVVPKTYKGPFIVRQENGGVSLQEHCKGHISTYVNCPSLKCGTRVESYSQEFESRYLRNRKMEDSRLKREETGRVVGGRESEPRAWPWAVAVYKDGAFHCGGVILDEKWVLTAAHCMEQYWKHFYEVRGGMLRRFSFSAMEQIRSVADVIIHEDYDQAIMSNDLALLRMLEPFHFNRWVRPGCLPSLRDGLSKFYWGPAPGTRCIAVGWGALKERGIDPDQLREVEIPILNRCKHKEDLVGEEICAGKAEGGKDTCQGDSGGPLLCRDSSFPPSWYVAGIVSHGEGCARPGEPGAYTRVSLFVDWITANANDLQLPSLKPLKTCPGLRCRSGVKLCINTKWVCNGFTDCLEAEDEINCTTLFNFEQRNSDSENKEVLSVRIPLLPTGEEEQIKTTESPAPEEAILLVTKSTETEMAREKEALVTGVSIAIEAAATTGTTIIATSITTETTATSTTTTTPTPTATKTSSRSMPVTSSGLPTTPVTTTEVTLEVPESILGFPTKIEVTSTEGEKEILPTSEESLSKEIKITEISSVIQPTELIPKLLQKTQGMETENIHTVDKDETTLELKDPEFGMSSDTPNSKEVEETTAEFMTKESEILEKGEKFYTEPFSIITEINTPVESIDALGEPKIKEKGFLTEILNTEKSIQTTAEPTVYTSDIEAESLPVTTEAKLKSDVTEASTAILQAETEDPSANAVTVLSSDKIIEITSETLMEIDRVDKSTDIVRVDVIEDSQEAETTTTVTETKEESSTMISGYSEMISVSFQKIGDPITESSEEKEMKSEDEDKANEKKKIDSEEKEEIEDETEDETEDEEMEEEKVEKQTSKEEHKVEENISESSEEATTAMNNPKTTGTGTNIYSETTTAQEKTSETNKDFYTPLGIDPRLLETTSTSMQSSEVSTTLHSIRARETTYESLDTSTEEMTEDQTEGSDILRWSFHNSSAYFQCRQIVQSILQTYKCDGVEDCEDGTDEENCTCAQALINSNPKLICDGKIDCPDRSDEIDCASCPKGRYFCRISRECIPSGERCNGEKNCEFGEDEAKCLGLSPTGEEEEFVQTEGFFMTNRKGIWTVECQEETPLTARMAIEACTAAGTIGYDKFENRSVGLGCTGFYVTCSRNLISSFDRYQSMDGSYRWPWHAFVFVEGVPACSAALLEPRWLLTSSDCLENVTLESAFLVAKLGSRKEWSRLKEPGVKLIRIDGVRTIPDTDVALLHLSTEANDTEFVRSMGIPHVMNSDLGTDLCVATADRSVLLKPLRRCPDSSRCYRKINPTLGNCRSKPWSGVIACQSRFGWYPASVYLERSGHCGFKNVKFTNVQDKVQDIRQALAQEPKVVPQPFCSGFRCLQGSCIPLSKKCNGWPDCPSHEDENADLCSKKAKRDCEATELRCRNGRCIPKVLFGDGVDHCGDGSDEPASITCAEYLNLTAPEKLCDGKRNCYDKSDEQYRLCKCSEHKFPCHRSGHCVPKDFVCDGEEDCPAGEDEEQCVGRKIVKNHEKNYLEILENSYGVWHSACPSEVSKEHSDVMCRDLGYKEALFTYVRNRTVLTPEMDTFSWVKLNARTHIALRGDRPFVRLVNRKRTCAAVKCV